MFGCGVWAVGGVGFGVGVFEKGVEFRDPFIPSTHIPKAQAKSLPGPMHGGLMWDGTKGIHVGVRQHPCSQLKESPRLSFRVYDLRLGV